MSASVPYFGLDKLIPEMKERVELFLRKAKEAGLNIGITETYRTSARQKYLYAQGRTRPGKVVTWTLQSKHLIGEAIDVVFIVNGKTTYSGDWASLASIGESAGLSWGGRWKSPDMPHFEFNHDIMTLKDWELEAQEFVVKNGLSNGENPRDPVTRAQVWRMLQQFALRFNLK